MLGVRHFMVHCQDLDVCMWARSRQIERGHTTCVDFVLVLSCTHPFWRSQDFMACCVIRQLPHCHLLVTTASASRHCCLMRHRSLMRFARNTMLWRTYTVIIYILKYRSFQMQLCCALAASPLLRFNKPFLDISFSLCYLCCVPTKMDNWWQLQRPIVSRLLRTKECSFWHRHIPSYHIA